MSEVFESYTDFADHARNIRRYGNWHYTSKKATKKWPDVWVHLPILRSITDPRLRLHARYTTSV